MTRKRGVVWGLLGLVSARGGEIEFVIVFGSRRSRDENELFVAQAGPTVHFWYEGERRKGECDD